MSGALLAVITLAASSFMAAIGWYVQLVHYPTFRLIPAEKWSEFHKEHSVKTGVIVVPAMLLEGCGAVALALNKAAPGLKTGIAWVGVLLALFAIGWTFGVSSLIHTSLSSKFDETRLDKLIRTNLPRTLAWTLHMLVCAAYLVL